MKNGRKVAVIVLLVVLGYCVYSEIVYYVSYRQCADKLMRYKDNQKTINAVPIMINDKVVGVFVCNTVEIFQHPGFDSAIVEIGDQKMYSRYHFCAGPDFEELQIPRSGNNMFILVSNLQSFTDMLKDKYNFRDF